MKKSAVLNTYLTAVMALAMTFAVACTGSGQLPGLGGQGKDAATPQQPLADGQPDGAGGEDGTTDGNGGNGVNGKIYESYIVNPQELAAYKQIIQPKMESLDKSWNAAEKAEDAVPLFNLIWKFKKWYIAPVSLNSLKKKTIGVEFTKENTEQLALQTDSEVWIDSRLFEKMSITEQAQLLMLMHEYTMNAYLIKFDSIYDLCTLASTRAENPEHFNCGTRAEVDKVMPPEPKRDLNKTDYSRIRYMTSTLLENNSFGTKKDLSNLLLINGFDNRVFKNNVDSSSKSEQVDVSANEIVIALKGIAYSQAMNGPCVGVQSGIEKNCIFEVKDETPASANGFKVLKISLKDASTQEVLRSSTVSIFDTKTTRMTETNMIYLSYWDSMPDTEGALTDGLRLEFEKYKDAPAQLKNVFFVRNIVTAIITAPPKNTETWQCKEVVSKLASYIRTSLFEQDVIYLGTATKESQSELRRVLNSHGHTECKK